MAVLELLLLRLREGVSPIDPILVKNLATVRSLVHTNSRFYHCLEDPRLVYILGQWPSLAAHRQFLSSSEKEQILSHQTHQLDFEWMLHLELPEGVSAMENVIPFSAPVLGIERVLFETSGSGVDGYERVLEKRRRRVVDTARPYPLLGGWRIDAQEGRAEYVMITGWESVDAHSESTKEATREESQEDNGVRNHAVGIEVRHARNMEA